MKDYNQQAEMIYKRKSVREFSGNPAEIFENGYNLMELFGVKPLIDSIKVKVITLKKDKINNKRSNYCIAFYSEEKPLCLENIGFIGQQIDLALQSKGLGTCWWGMKKPKRAYKNMDGLHCVITMTAGHPLKDEQRVYPDGFERKAVKDILLNDTQSDRFIEAVRIAPSAVNLQPWLIEKIDGKYNFYIRKPKTIMEKMVSKMRHIDIGIALAHFFILAKAGGVEPSFGFEGKDIEQGKFVISVTG